MTDATHFRFGSSVGNVGSDDASSTPSREQEFTFTSDSGGGYLDDQPSTSSWSEPSRSGSKRGGSGSVNSTTLFSHLVQRQFDQQSRQPLSQAEYDDPTQWSHSPSHPRSRDQRDTSENESSYTSTSDSGSDESYDSLQLQKEWEEQLEQLQLMFQIIIFPFIGKFIGRKFSYFRK